MPAISWSDANSNLKPTPSWRFYCTLPTVDGTSLNGQTLAFYVERISAPQVGASFEPAPFNSGERQFPNMRTIGQITMTLAEDTNYSVIQYLRAWKNLIVDDNGNYGLPSNYKKQIQLQPLDETGASNFTFSWQGCAPTQVDAYDFDGSVSKHVSCNVVFVVDSMDPFSVSSTSTSSTQTSSGASSVGTTTTGTNSNSVPQPQLE